MKLQWYPCRGWTFSKLRKPNVLIKLIINILNIKCPKCGGRVKYIGDDWITHSWISIYRCNKCGREFI